MKFSFLGFGQETAPLQLYGKLPIAKDYLRIGCGDGPGRDLREWLDRTFGTTRGEELVLREPLRFIGQSEKEPLQGYVWPSSDAGEHRRFPFTLFVQRERKALQADLFESNLTEAEGVWRILAETREACLSATDGQSLLAEFRGRDVKVSMVEEVRGAPADFDYWVHSLWGAEGLDGLRAVLEQVRRQGRAEYGGPYRFPLVRALPLRDQVIAWVHAMRAVGVLGESEIPTLFFPPRALIPSREPAELVLSRRPLRDDDVGWITSGPETPVGPADYAIEGAGGEEASSPPEAEIWLRDPLLGALRALSVDEG